MNQGNFYILSNHPNKDFKQVLSGIEFQKYKVEYDSVNDTNILICSDLEDARKAYFELVKSKEGETSNYWYYIVLNEMGYIEFKALRNTQKFRLSDIKDYKNEDIDLSKLEYQFIGSFGGGVLKGKKTDFKSALNFWINSITKITNDNIGINADLFGGTYNPVSLKSLHFNLKCVWKIIFIY